MNTDKDDARKGFVFYRSWWTAIVNLPRDIQGEVLTAIIEYGLTGVTTGSLKPITKAVLELVKPQIEANRAKYENGMKGGRPPKRESTEVKPNKNQNETEVKPNKNQNETKGEPIRININIKDSEDKSSSSEAGEADGFAEKIEEYKKQKPLWKERIMMKFGMTDSDVDMKLDDFYLDMCCKEVDVRCIGALFTKWLKDGSSDETKESKSGNKPQQRGNRARQQPAEPGYGLVD